MSATPGAREIIEAVEHPHRRALAVLDDASSGSLAGVAWLATHLAATEQVLHPVALRTLPDGARRVRTQRGCDRRLHKALWRLDRRLTGDVHAAAQPVDVLEAQVRDALRQHAACEEALVTDLARLLDVDTQHELLQRLDDAVLQAPTRPHPDTPHLALTGRLLFRLDALADRCRDLMDNRSVPTPRRRHEARPVGRWASYLMAAPYPPTERLAEPAPAEQDPSSTGR